MAISRRDTLNGRGWDPRQLPGDLNFELDPGHALAKGLVALYAPALSFNDVLFPQNPTLARPSAGGFVATSSGPGWNSPTSASGSLFAAGLPTRLQSQTYTMVWIGRANGTSFSADQTIFSIGAGTSPFVRVGWFLYSGASGDLHTMDSYNGSFAFTGTGVPLASLQSNVHLVGTFNTGLQKTYLNGTATASAGNHAGTLSFNSSTDSIQLGDTRAGPGVTSVAGFIYNRFLSTDEIRWHASAPFDMLRPLVRRMYLPGVAGGPSTVVFFARTLAGSGPRAAVQIVAPIAATTRAKAGDLAGVTLSAAVQAKLATRSGGKGAALGVGLAVAKTEAAPQGRSVPRGVALPAATTKAGSGGRATNSLVATLAAITRAAASGRALPGGIAQLAAAARAGAASAGRAAATGLTAVAGRLSASAPGRAAASGAASLTAKTQAQASARATIGGIAQLSAAARAGAASAGRAGMAALTSVSARLAASAVLRATASGIAPLTAKTEAQASARASLGGVAQLVAAARAGAASAGRAAASAAASVTARTTPGGAGRAGIAASASVAARTEAHAAGRASASSAANLAAMARAGAASAGRAGATLVAPLAARTAAAVAGKARTAPLGVSLIARTASRLRSILLPGRIAPVTPDPETTGFLTVDTATGFLPVDTATGYVRPTDAPRPKIGFLI